MESAYFLMRYSYTIIILVLRILREISKELIIAIYTSRKARTSKVRSQIAISIILLVLKVLVVDYLVILIISLVIRLIS